MERFAWERGRWSVDADGRPFRHNANYSTASLSVDLALAAAEGRDAVGSGGAGPGVAARLESLLRSARETVRGILAAAGKADAVFRARRGGRAATLRALWGEVDRVLAARARWWEGDRKSVV